MVKKFEEFKNIVDETTTILNNNSEWIERFAAYAQAINENIGKIKNNKKLFRQWSPLYLYITVGSAKNPSESIKFSLRYSGQDVASLIVGGPVVLFSTKGYDEKNEKYFGCKVVSGEKVSWGSDTAVSFRKHFKSCPQRQNDKKGNDEHKIESMLLTELSKNVVGDKLPGLRNMRPVKIAEICRFQMPTPLSASSGKVCYSTKGHGHSDILARVGKGRGTKLCIMEVKDQYSKNEPPLKVLKQGLIYAVFIRALLRSKSGQKWWKIFGFSGDVPDSLTLYVSCAMPLHAVGESDKSFVDKEVTLGYDSFKFHYVYFEESNNKITQAETSMGRKS